MNITFLTHFSLSFLSLYFKSSHFDFLLYILCKNINFNKTGEMADLPRAKKNNDIKMNQVKVTFLQSKSTASFLF